MAQDKKKDYSCLVGLDEEGSSLRVDLNKGVALLVSAEKTYFRPHICLNRENGPEVIKRIAQNPESAKTSFSINFLLDYHGKWDGMWLNVYFSVYLDDEDFEHHGVALSPRQTGYIVQNLPPDSQRVVLKKVQIWFTEVFLREIQEVLEHIGKQFQENMLVKGVHQNRIFDIHEPVDSRKTFRDPHEDTFYTEVGLVGTELFYAHFYPSLGEDGGLEAVDSFLKHRACCVKERAGAFVGAVRALSEFVKK